VFWAQVGLFCLGLSCRVLSCVFCLVFLSCPHQILGKCSPSIISPPTLLHRPWPHLPQLHNYPLQNFLCTRDITLFFFVSGTALESLEPLQPHRPTADVWQVPHQPPNPLQRISCLKLFPCLAGRGQPECTFFARFC
jgi:hypothetical protein